MPLIWAAISGHGYGHAAQVVPVLNALAKRVPGLTAVLRTTVPHSFFRDRLTIPWTHQPVQQDVGCVQKGPLEIDVSATWEALADFHATWDRRVAEEEHAIRASAPRVIVADTPYLSVEAGSRAGVPVVSLANFTWDDVLSPLMTQDASRHHSIVTSIARAYRHAALALRIEPGLPLHVFREIRDIGPIADPAPSRRAELRQRLTVASHERTVLVGFGGIPLPSLPWERMASMRDHRFIFDGAIPASLPNVHPLAHLPYTFKEVLASVDVIMTKPGYGTTIEAVTLGIPVVFVRRHNFADEPPLVAFLQRYDRAVELSLDEFLSGDWHRALEEIRLRPLPSEPPPAPNGADDAAALLTRFF
jgi:hypothetical protein